MALRACGNDGIKARFSPDGARKGKVLLASPIKLKVKSVENCVLSGPQMHTLDLNGLWQAVVIGCKKN